MTTIVSAILKKNYRKERAPSPCMIGSGPSFFVASVPKFGDHVLFARQGFHATGQVFRQRVYKFQISSEEGCIMNKIYKLKDEAWFEKAEKDPSSVAELIQ